MNREIIELSKYLWDGSEPGWCLMELTNGNAMNYTIINIMTRAYLLIEDEEEKKR